MNIKYVLAAVLAVSILTGCGKKQTVRHSAELPSEVVVARPIVRDFEKTASYSAKIGANEYVEIRARVGGYLDSVEFKKGANVKKGEVLFRIDSRPYAAALAAAEANVKAVESKIKLAEENALRARGLFKRNAISKEAYQTRETELLVANAKLLEAKAAERNARLNMEFTEVVAPVSGRVGENFVDAGNLVAAHATKLARIVDNSVAKVYFELNSADAVRYKNSGLLADIDAGRGAKVSVVMKGDSRAYEGVLCYYDNALGAGTASLVLRADIPNADGGLMAGAFADITVSEGVAKNALLVPEDAIGTDMVGRFVWVVDEADTVRQTPVVLGAADGNLRVIESGLDADSRVVVKGIQRASSGRKVKPVEEK